MKWICVLALLVGMMAACRGEMAHLARKVVLPDGKPAAGATVLIRRFGNDFRLQDEKQLTLGDDGLLQADVEIPTLKDDRIFPAYFMIDAPGCALFFARVCRYWGRDRETITLVKEFRQSGRLVDNDNAPVGGAPVTVGFIPLTSLAMWAMNMPALGVATPQLVTESAKDGTFSLRGALFEGSYNAPNPAPDAVNAHLWALATVNGTVLGGENDAFPFSAPGVKPPPPMLPPYTRADRATITLAPTQALTGQVIQAVTHAPVAGAVVHCYGSPPGYAHALAPVKTDAKGRFVFPAVIPAPKMYVLAEEPSLVSAWKPVQGETTIAMPPWATISGKLTDRDTGQPAITPQAIFTNNTPRGPATGDNMITFGGEDTRADVQPGGAFTLRAAVGEHEIRYGGKGYMTTLPEYYSLSVPPEGVKNLAYTVKKWTGYLVRFDTTHPKLLAVCQVDLRHPDGSVSGTGVGSANGGWWALGAQKWGETLEIRLVDWTSGKPVEVVPWTAITAGNDAAHWPQVIKF